MGKFDLKDILLKFIYYAKIGPQKREKGTEITSSNQLNRIL